MPYSVEPGGRLRTQHDDPHRVARAPRAPSTKARAVDAGVLVGGAGPRPADRLGPGEVLRLQRSAGNAAVARLLAGQRSPVIQRSKESEELLTKLATPKVGEGQAIEVQKQLVNGLDTIYNQKYGHLPEKDQPATVKLGGVLIDWLPNADKTYMPTGGNTAEAKQQRKKDVQGLYEQLVRYPFEAAQFVNLDTNDPKGAIFPADHRIGADVKTAGLGPKVVENTLKTMIDAEQFEYLRLAGLPNKDWKILVEMHYIRFRPKDMAGFHKDTQGQTLFVNLNYHVPGHKLRGPEYVLNPPPSTEHDKLISGPQGLPEEFLKDLTMTRKALGDPTTIESAGTVEGLGYVAFVDEAIHHATPWFGHRYVTPSEFEAYLKRRYPAEFDAIFKADPQDLAKAVRKSGAAKKKGGYSKLVEGDDLASWSTAELKKWKKWRAMATVAETREEKKDRVKKYTREDFAGTMPGDNFDLMLEDVGSQENAAREKAGAGGWYAASIPQAGLPSIRPKNKPPLKRTASSADLTKGWPEQLPEDVPRRFTRSWVRAVPENYAAKVRYT